MIFSDIFGSSIWVSRRIGKLSDAKTEIGCFCCSFSVSLVFHYVTEKLVLQILGAINFHDFLFLAVQNFNLGSLQKFKFRSKFFEFGYFGLGYFGFDILE